MRSAAFQCGIGAHTTRSAAKMLIEGLLCIVSLSPVRGPGPRAARLGAIADTLGRRARIAVLIARDHEDAALSIKTLAERNATGSIQAWELPIEDHTPRFNQFRAHVYGLRRALEARHSWFFLDERPHVSGGGEPGLLLNGLSRTEPVYAGLRFWGPCCGLFNSAAAGYAVNRPAVELLVNRWREIDAGATDEKCDPSSKKAQIALCLKRFDVVAIDTREASGAERFHVYGPVRLATGAIDDWLVNKKRTLIRQKRSPPTRPRSPQMLYRFITSPRRSIGSSTDSSAAAPRSTPRRSHRSGREDEKNWRLFAPLARPQRARRGRDHRTIAAASRLRGAAVRYSVETRFF